MVLLDVARDLVIESGAPSLTVGTVAERAEVTRALVYKHFANRDDVLVELYRRETKAADKAIRRAVEATPGGFEPKWRAMIRATAHQLDAHAPFLEPLRAVRSAPSAQRDRRSWDSRSIAYFSDLATVEFGLDPTTARLAVAILLPGMFAALGASRQQGTDISAFEQVAVDTALGALAHLGS